MAPMLSARTILPLKGDWSASTPEPPEMADTWADRMCRVWEPSSYTQSSPGSPPVTVKGLGYSSVSSKPPVRWSQRR